MKKRKHTKLRVRLLKIINAIAIVAFILFGCCLDSDSWVPMVVCIICGAWLLLIAIANTDDGGSWNG